MATENYQQDQVLSFHTDAAVTKNLGAILKAGREVAKASAAGERIVGVILDTQTTAGKPIGVLTGPAFKLVTSGAAFLDLKPLAMDANAKFIEATAGMVVVAIAMEAATAADESVLVFLLPMSQYRIASASVVDLTDNTGLSGTHDDTLAATTVPTITATNPAAPTAYAAVVNMSDPVTKAQGEAVSAALATLRGEVATYETAISALVVDVAAILALLAVMVQNQSDTAQKIKELVAVLDAQASTL
jgi:hypothetical protein